MCKSGLAKPDYNFIETHSEGDWGWDNGSSWGFQCGIWWVLAQKEREKSRDSIWHPQRSYHLLPLQLCQETVSQMGSKGGDPGQRKPEGTAQLILDAYTQAGKQTENSLGCTVWTHFPSHILAVPSPGLLDTTYCSEAGSFYSHSCSIIFLPCFGGGKLTTAAWEWSPVPCTFVVLPNVGLNAEALEKVTTLSF